MATTGVLMTYDQYLELPDQDGVRRELDEGRVIETPRASFAHNALQGRVVQLFMNWVERTGVDFLVSQDAGFLMAVDTERAPDVCLVRRSAFRAMERVKGGSHRGAPDLAVDVVSPGDTAEDLDRKIEQYLQAGATAVWLVYSATRHVMVYRGNGDVLRLCGQQALEEPELLPGFRVTADEVFSKALLAE